MSARRVDTSGRLGGRDRLWCQVSFVGTGRVLKGGKRLTTQSVVLCGYSLGEVLEHVLAASGVCFQSGERVGNAQPLLGSLAQMRRRRSCKLVFCAKRKGMDDMPKVMVLLPSSLEVGHNVVSVDIVSGK